MIQLPQINNHESERLSFRDLVADDAPSLFKIYSNKEAMKYRHSQAMTNLAAAQDFILHQKTATALHYIIRKGVSLKATNELIGSVMYKYHKAITNTCEIGYSIGADFWGRGFGREIVASLISNIKTQQNIQVIKAWTIKENIASKRILELNDFQQVAQEEFAGSYLYKYQC